ncbi:MAG: vWA domain-containing protein [Acidimicrobiales bacterium]
MPFHVYPDPPTAPVALAASATSAPVPFAELAAVDPVTTLTTMYIRVVKLGTACAPSGAPHPRLRLKHDGGDFTTVFDPVGPPTVPAGTIVSINAPVGTGGAVVESANTQVTVEANDVYLITVFIFNPGNPWQLEIRNNDAGSGHGFTWVVASTNAESHQPWIDIPSTLAYNVLTGQVVPQTVQVANRGTGPLTVSPPMAPPGPGFAVTVPPAVNPNACGNLQVTFTGPGTPGTSAADYTVASDDTTAQLVAGHNRRVHLSTTTGRLEVVLLLDASGSMNVKPSGDPVVAATDSRWSRAVTAASQFLDLLKAFGGGLGRFGVARFPHPTVPCPSSADIQTAVDISSVLIDGAKGALAASPAPAGFTPIADGIGRAIGTVAGSFGYFESSPASQQFNRRWLVLLSDGVHNCEPPFALLGGPNAFTNKKVLAITVGYGDPGASVYAPDPAQLLAIATASGPAGLSFDAGPDDLGMGLLKMFRTAIAAALTLDPSTDPPGVLSPTQREVRRTVVITEYESKAAFVVNWGTADRNRVRVEIVTPNCELITPSVAQADPDIEFSGDPRYAIYTVNHDYIRNGPSPGNPRFGEWTLIVSAGTLGELEREDFEYEVIFESRLKMALSFDTSRYFAGVPIEVTARLTLDGLPVTGASVTCRLTSPRQFGNNWLARRKVTAAELAEARDVVVGSDANAVTVKAMALRLRGEVFNRWPEVTSVAMTDPDEVGRYRATITDTATPGTYDFLVTAVGETPEGVTFRRERRSQVRVEVQPDPTFTYWHAVYERTVIDGRVFFTADVQVFALDGFDNVHLVDPDVAGMLEIAADDGELVGSLVGNLDGSYSQQVRFDGGSRPVLSLAIAEQPVTVRQPLVSPAALAFADKVVAFKRGYEAEKGANRHCDPKDALGDVTVKPTDRFVSLGGFGRVVFAVYDHVIVSQGDDDITVFVRPDDGLRSYQVDVRRPGRGQRWTKLGTSPGVTKSFSLRGRVEEAAEVRIGDTSGRARTSDFRPSESPGVSILGVGFGATRKTETQ